MAIDQLETLGTITNSVFAKRDEKDVTKIARKRWRLGRLAILTQRRLHIDDELARADPITRSGSRRNSACRCGNHRKR
jgi:hypothetical protein